MRVATAQARLKRVVFVVSMALALASLRDQLRRPGGERTWHGAVFGVPYDFRWPSGRRTRAAWWNPEDRRLFTPRDFGVGWAVNLARLRDLASRRARPNHDGAAAVVVEVEVEGAAEVEAAAETEATDG